MNLVTMTFDADEWQVVPKLPTQSMFIAFQQGYLFQACYGNMLSAAPQPPAVSAEPVMRVTIESDNPKQLGVSVEQLDALFDLPKGSYSLFASPPNADEKDAARYRWLLKWLTNQDDETYDAMIGAAHTPEAVSAVIDTAMQKGGE